MRRRQVLALAGGSSAVLLSGCGGSTDETRPSDAGNATEEPEPVNDDAAITSSNDPADTQEAVSANADAAQTPDPDHAVAVENNDIESATVRVAVRRKRTGKAVYDRTHTVQPHEDKTVYNTRQAGPDGVETFLVDVSAAGTSERVAVDTNACFGDVRALITEAGELDTVYSTC
jgi:hypothetical protein